MGVVHILNTVL